MEKSQYKRTKLTFNMSTFIKTVYTTFKNSKLEKFNIKFLELTSITAYFR